LSFGDPYHASLDPAEYEALLASAGFELIEYSSGDQRKVDEFSGSREPFNPTRDFT
jgi:hypothetical protein